MAEMTGSAENTYVALEIGRGGPRQQRVSAAELCRQWNEALRDGPVTLKFEPGRGATGNYLLIAFDQANVGEVSNVLGQRLQRRFAVFSAEAFLGWVGALAAYFSTARPQLTSNRRPTPGAVMDLNPNGGMPPDLPDPDPDTDPVEDRNAWSSSAFAVPRVRSVWKNDLLRDDGKTLDRDRREGTWGALARAMQRQHGGKWTARALSTLRGLAKKVEEQLSVRRGVAAPARSDTPEIMEANITGDRRDVGSLLRAAVRQTRLAESVDRYLNLSGRDPVQAMVLARSIAEALARLTCDENHVDTQRRSFAALCQEISGRNLLSVRHQAYLNALRRLGNFAVHEARAEDVEAADIETSSLMLLQLSRAVLRRQDR